MVYRILDFISWRILNIKVWWIYTWMIFMTSLSVILLFSGQLTTELYYATMLNIATPMIIYIAIQYYKRTYIK